MAKLECLFFSSKKEMRERERARVRKRNTGWEKEWARLSYPARESQRVTFREDPRWAYPGNTDGNKKSAFSN